MLAPQALPNSLILVNAVSLHVIDVVSVKAAELLNGCKLHLVSLIFCCLFCELLQPIFMKPPSIFPCSTSTQSFHNRLCNTCITIICLLCHESSTVKYKHTKHTHKTYTIKETTNMHPMKPQKRVSLHFYTA